jgi:ankyrin repeat protein
MEDGMNPIHAAARYNSSKALRYLLGLGTQQSSPPENDRGETALHIAVAMGYLESVKVLVKGSCDPRLPDRKGRNVIHAAASSGKLKIVKCSLQKQPSYIRSSLVDQRGSDGKTMLHSAVQGENFNIISFLLEIRRKSNIGSTSTSSPYI